MIFSDLATKVHDAEIFPLHIFVFVDLNSYITFYCLFSQEKTLR